MTRIQSASQSTPDPNTIYCSVEVSRSSWIVGVHCPLTDANIGIHKLPPGSANDLIDLARKLLVALWQLATRGLVPEGAIIE